MTVTILGRTLIPVARMSQPMQDERDLVVESAYTIPRGPADAVGRSVPYSVTVTDAAVSSGFVRTRSENRYGYFFCRCAA